MRNHIFDSVRTFTWVEAFSMLKLNLCHYLFFLNEVDFLKPAWRPLVNNSPVKN